MLPEVAAVSLGGEANHEQHTTAGTVLQQAGRSSGGHQLGTARGQVSTDSDDDDLIPLRDMLLAGDEPPSPVDHQQVGPCLRVGGRASQGPRGHPGAHQVLWYPLKHHHSLALLPRLHAHGQIRLPTAWIHWSGRKGKAGTPQAWGLCWVSRGALALS